MPGAVEHSSRLGPRRRVLIVAPAFPPHPSPATHRARYLARYGPRFGWDADVLSVRPEFYEEELDPELERLVPADVRVVRTGAFRAGWTRRLGVGDLGLRSYVHLRAALHGICRTARPDVLFFPGGPFYPFVLGAEARARFGIPYVLDFTDPWVVSPEGAAVPESRKAYWHQRIGRALEPIAVRHAAHIVAVSRSTNEALRARHPYLPTSRFSAHPFGFEPRDFDLVDGGRGHPLPWAEDGHIHVAYVGAVSSDMARTVGWFLDGVRRARARGGEMAGVRVHFVGTSYDPGATEGVVLPIARSLNIDDVVTEQPRRIPYGDALRALAAADVVVALGSIRAHYTASKIFPCVLARRPLLAIVHAGSGVGDIVREAGSGEVIEYGNAETGEELGDSIADAIARLIGRRHEQSPPPRLDGLRLYSAERIVGELCATFDRVVDENNRAVAPRGTAGET